MYQLNLIQNLITEKEEDHLLIKIGAKKKVKVKLFVILQDTCLYIGNLDKRCPEDKLKDICKEFGPFEYCYIVFEPTSHHDRNRDTKISRGYAFVKYEN